MIPVNNAIIVALAAMGAVAVITAWAARGYWRARVGDAYSDGHLAGIATQIGRYQRALDRRRADDNRVVGAYLERVRPALAGEPATDVLAAARPALALPAPDDRQAVIIPFPEGLPPGLREFATAQMTAADAASWAVAR